MPPCRRRKREGSGHAPALNPGAAQRHRPERLTPRQRALLALHGYPHVMEEFRFHLTLTGALAGAEHPVVAQAAATHFAGLAPQPFRLSDICLTGEDAAGRFHLLHRYALAV